MSSYGRLVRLGKLNQEALEQYPQLCKRAAQMIRDGRADEAAELLDAVAEPPTQDNLAALVRKRSEAQNPSDAAQ